MRRFARFWSQPVSERRLRVSALLVVAGVRLMLTLIPFRTLSGILGVLEGRRAAPKRVDLAEAIRIGNAVRTAALRVPRATCLTQALALRLLLRRRGMAAQLRIGVARDENGALLAHAWVESGDRVVIGGDVGGYTPLGQRVLD